MISHCFDALKRNYTKNKYHREIIERFRDERMARFYNIWRKGYLAEQAKVDFFNKTMICIKNNIAKRAYKTLALHALKGRLKKRADIHRY